jgi:S-adenosylmethionine hydrolase
MGIITLTTDFGASSGYVGVMKGVILSIAPQARLVDLTHAVPPQDVRFAAYELYAAVPFFPDGTVHLVVVDPGVGTERRAIAVHTPGAVFVGPDNGLFTYALTEAERWRAVELASRSYRLPQVSATFHGRDVFAPAAAHLAAGVSFDDLGPAVTDPILLAQPRLEIDRTRLAGEVLHVDRFGNLITSIGRLRWQGGQLTVIPAFRPQSVPKARFPAARVHVRVADQELKGVHRTYGDTPAGEVVALVGSGGFLEIAVSQGSAAQRLDLRSGAPVEILLR